MNKNDYIVSEFTGTTLALRKTLGKQFSVDELQTLSKELRSVADIKTLYVSETNNKQRIQNIVITFHAEEDFGNYIEKFLSPAAASTEGFSITGFQYDENNEYCTIMFHSVAQNGFTDSELRAIAHEMFYLGAETVLNKRHHGKSNLHYRLHTFEIMSEYDFIDPIREIACTFKCDAVGVGIIKELFRRFSEAPKSLLDDCFAHCVLSAYQSPSSCTLLNYSSSDTFDMKVLSRICYWLHTAGAKSAITDTYEAFCRVYNSSIKCTFDEDDQSFDIKLADFIEYWNEKLLTKAKHSGWIPADATVYNPELYLQFSTKLNSFTLYKDINANEEFTRAERGYFLNYLLQLGAESITTEKQTIKCVFSSDTEGRELMAKAICELLKN